MANFFLNILTLGIKPLYEKQKRFHELILEYRSKFANPGRASMVRSDIEEFYDRLGNFNFKFVFFKSYYREYIENLERFRPRVEENDFDLTFLRIALSENKWKPTQPLPVLLHHIKYKFRLTANPFITFQKKKQREKLDSISKNPDKNSKIDQSKKWTRVPINQSKDRQ